MAQTFSAPDRPRWSSALGVGLLHAGLGYLLLVGLGVAPAPTVPDAISLIPLRPAPSPVSPEPSGAPAPVARKANPVPKVAPPVVVPPSVPTVAAAPLPSLGSETAAGAADIDGPGTGGGGEGVGTGSGGEGYGSGGGGTPPRWLSGRIRPSDYPEDAFDDGIEGITGIRLQISDRGRVTSCAVTRSSGDADLDRATCRLITKRFRYEPARDADGRPIAGEEDGAQEWIIRRNDAE